ncbi:YtxH domain-containing protein [Fredinandcohnia humi]
MATTKSLLYGVLIGSVIAGITVLLSTPTTGKSIRKVLKNDHGVSLTPVLSDGGSLKDQIVDTTKKTIHTLSDISGDVKTSIQSWKKEIKVNQKNIQKELLEIETALQSLEKSVSHR